MIYLRHFALTIIPMLIIYLIGAFIAWSFDPGAWLWLWRLAVAGVASFFGLLGFIISLAATDA